MWEDREEEVSCLRKENLGQSCIELRIPHTKRTDRRTDGRWSLEGAQKMPIKTLGNSDGPWMPNSSLQMNMATIRNFSW